MPATVRLAAGTAQALAALVAEIAGAAPRALPWLAPALLFASPGGQRHLALPTPGPDELLIHDYQSVAYASGFPLDAPLAAEAETRGNDRHVTLSANGAPVATLTTALRLIRRADLTAARPAPFPRRLADNLDWSAPLTASQDRTDRYLALSGDLNPIHRDAALAASLGLPAPIVPGLLLAALVQPAAEARNITRLTSLKARFMAPLTVDAAFRLALQPRGDTGLRAYLACDTHALALIDLGFAA